VSPWPLKRLKSHNTLDVREMMNDFNAKVEARSSGEWIVEVVNVGDNVVICVDNSTNDSF
jgi:hypothetical protein